MRQQYVIFINISVSIVYVYGHTRAQVCHILCMCVCVCVHRTKLVSIFTPCRRLLINHFFVNPESLFWLISLARNFWVSRYQCLPSTVLMCPSTQLLCGFCKTELLLMAKFENIFILMQNVFFIPQCFSTSKMNLQVRFAFSAASVMTTSMGT